MALQKFMNQKQKRFTDPSFLIILMSCKSTLVSFIGSITFKTASTQIGDSMLEYWDTTWHIKKWVFHSARELQKSFLVNTWLWSSEYHKIITKIVNLPSFLKVIQIHVRYTQFIKKYKMKIQELEASILKINPYITHVTRRLRSVFIQS